MTSLRELFEGALALPPAERAVWLDRHCPDPAMRARLERMLADTAATGDSVPHTPAAALAEAIGEVQPPPPGTRVGSFELVELLGEGGHATVFRAARETDGVRQEVALKLLRHGIYTPQAQRQFRREREALAQLRHPGIAGLIEGGVTPSGLAYIALELVDGVPITQYARDRQLDLRARLALFVQVCRAVEAAHRALIVHRDLKPSNVLVTPQGRVQLIDFGVAKIIDAEDATQTHTPGFTPAYAAPEQHRGEPVTTAADVYALGVLLGELVTGQRLNDGSGRTPSSRITGDTDPGDLPAPPRVTLRLLRGDLDNIVLKAIEAEPERRYVSAGALADDVQAHLDGRPVAAHPPSRWYRTRKFVARHRGGVASAVIVVLAILTALAVAVWQAQLARAQAQRAAEVQRFVESLFEPLAAGNQNASAPTVTELVQRGLARVGGEGGDVPRDAGVRADLLAMFARINDGMGEVHSNVALTEQAWQATAAAFGPDDPRALDARLLYAGVLRKDSQFQRADEELKLLLAQLQRLRIGGVLYARALDTQINAQAGYLTIPREDVLARRREVLRIVQADPEATPDQEAGAWNNVGNALELVRDFPAAAAAYQKAYELRHAYLGDSAGAAVALSNVGNAWSWLKQWQRARGYFADARAMFERANVRRHPNYAGMLIRLCDIDVQLDDRDAALRDCAAALAMTETVFGTDNGEHAMALVRDGSWQLQRGDAEMAATRFATARRIFAAQPGDTGGRLRTVDIAEAARWRVLGDYATLRDRLLPVAAMPQYAEHWAAPLVFSWLALACDMAPSPECGADRRAAAEAILAKPSFAEDPLRLAAITALARIDLRHGERAKAASLLQDAMAKVRELGPGHVAVAEAALVLAEALDDPAAAAQARARAEAIIAELPPGHFLHAAATPR